MARARDIIVRFLGDDKDLVQSNKKVQSSIAGTATGADKLRKQFNAVRTAVVGVIATQIVRWAAGVVQALARIEKIGAQTNAVIKSTGGVANVTREQVDGLAASLENLTSIEAETITEGQNLLLTFTKIRNEVGEGNDIFDQATVSMVDMSVALGQDMAGAAVLLGKALNDPLKGLTAMGRAGVQFTQAQKDQIRGFVEANDVMSAQKIILEELNVQFGGSAEALGDTLTGRLDRFSNSLGNMGEMAVTVAIPALEDLVIQSTALLDTMGPMGAAAAQLKANLALLANDGFDLTALKAEAAAFGLREAFEGMGFALDPTERMAELLAVLNGELDLSVLEWTDLRNMLTSSHDQLGLTAEEMAVLIARIDEYRGTTDPAVITTQRWQAAMAEAAGATRDFTTALAEQRDAMKEATDPVFASAKAEERLAAAHDKYTRAVIESGDGSEEANTALGDLLQAQRDVETANANLADSFSGATLTALESWGAQIGINNEALRTWINLQREAAGLPPLALPGLPSGSNDRFALDQMNRALNTVNRGTVRPD